MSELLLELLSEEIPALMQKKAADAYLEIFSNSFLNNEISFDILQVFTGSRRITLYATGLPETIAAKTIEIKGPRVDAPPLAITGFCKSHNISKEELSEQLFEHQMFFIYKKHLPATDIKQLLCDTLPRTISSYRWPKSMYWKDYSLTWVRPLTNILCILDNQTLSIKLAHLTANNFTYGHKFLKPNKLENIQSFQDYQQRLEENKVIIDQAKRQKMITDQLQEVVCKYDLVINQDPKLLEEVTGLIEYPTVMIGKIADKFLKLPAEVLITSMRTHQKYFATTTKSGDFAPYFLFVSNNLPEHQDNIVKGNEKVLSARLSDALYFYHQDLQQGQEARLTKLDQMVFHAALGSMNAKTTRITKLCDQLLPDNRELQEAAKYCKTDLVSQMVQEFPELQGIMGYYYAVHEKLGEKVAVTIKDHYKPLGLADDTPTGHAASLALSDKIDSLVGLMLAGEKATGSKDPYALRRYAIAIIRIILTLKQHINLPELIRFSAALYSNDLENWSVKQGVSERSVDKLREHANPPQFYDANSSKQKSIYGHSNADEIIEFIVERAKFYFKEQYDISLINSVLDIRKDDLSTIELKLKTLQTFIASNKGQELVLAYKRINNILNDKVITAYHSTDHFNVIASEEKQSHEIASSVKPELLIIEEEVELNSNLVKITPTINDLIIKDNFESSLSLLATIVPYLHNFFDKVLVNDENHDIRNNRLLLLKNTKQLFLKIANFDCL